MVIGIGGVSNAGKSTLARNLKEEWTGMDVVSLCQDDFAFPSDQIPKIKDHIDWEVPESIDFVRFRAEALLQIKRHDIVILEGIFAFHDEVLNELMNVKLFLTLSKESFLERKNRDVRWGKEPDWYVEHIWNSHREYCRKMPMQDTRVLRADLGIDAKKIADQYLEPVFVLKNT